MEPPLYSISQITANWNDLKICSQYQHFEVAFDPKTIWINILETVLHQTVQSIKDGDFVSPSTTSIGSASGRCWAASGAAFAAGAATSTGGSTGLAFAAIAAWLVSVVASAVLLIAIASSSCLSSGTSLSMPRSAILFWQDSSSCRSAVTSFSCCLLMFKLFIWSCFKVVICDVACCSSCLCCLSFPIISATNLFWSAIASVILVFSFSKSEIPLP